MNNSSNLPGSSNLPPLNCSSATVNRPSSSKRKLSYLQAENKEDTFESVAGKGYVIVDIELLSELMKQFVKCKYCDSVECINLFEDTTSRKGLATKLTTTCSSCRASASSMTSKKVDRGYDLNIRLFYGMRCIGKGAKSAQTLCAMMDLPPPPRFSLYIDLLYNALKEVAEDSMIRAGNEAVVLNDDCKDITVALDGSWQKRGHTSLNGVVTATVLETGKVIDIECLSKYCHNCARKGDQNHNCVKNYDGYSGGMESEGAVRIFQRSESSRGVRYTHYLGDGDSKGFVKVSEANVYGTEVTITKLECCGHVQKRMGARLRKLRKDIQGKKLSDGKPLSGRGRLTDAQIDLLQQYYGLAIRRHTGCTDELEMRQAVWATYFHKLSTDSNPQHYLCPKGADSWCGYQRSQVTGVEYHHEHSLPLAVMEAIKPVYRSLTDRDLLRKCLHGNTQNPNESFNHCIWERVPKTVFVGLKTLKVAVLDAVICFNDGTAARKNVLRKLGINPGENMSTALHAIDKQRLVEADKDAQTLTKESRIKKRMEKKKKGDEESQTEAEYMAGMF